MQEELKERVRLWNINRGNTKLDFNLEVKMLTEERAEFWLATTLPHMMQEYCDFLFVSYGSILKMELMQYDSISMYSAWEDYSIALFDLMESKHKMLDRIYFYYLKVFHPDSTAATSYKATVAHKLIKAMRIVIEANEAKGTEKDVTGKVKKGEGHVDPVEKIKEMLYGNSDSERVR